jgi:ubiquinone/menaquinone biosynthesis C-methylase UbiE
MDRLISLLEPPPGARFLDAGCGTGDHARRIVRRGYSCTAVDISEYVLEIARTRAAAEGLQDRLTFACQKLEGLDFPDNTFDCVHCRGVLMHIPDWDQALGELCRVLKPGGRIAILEANDRALEPRLLQLLRRVRPSKSRLVDTPGGLELWSEIDGQPFVQRVANIPYLMRRLTDRGFRIVRRLGTEFLDISRFPAGLLRNTVIRTNRLLFRLGGLTSLSVGNAVVAEKLAR